MNEEEYMLALGRIEALLATGAGALWGEEFIRLSEEVYQYEKATTEFSKLPWPVSLYWRLRLFFNI